MDRGAIAVPPVGDSTVATQRRLESAFAPHAADTHMTESLPDRLSNDPRSPHYDEALLARGIGVRFNGVERDNVEEYCVSEGWVRVAAGRALDRRGQPMTLKVRGTVEPYFRGAEPAE